MDEMNGLEGRHNEAVQIALEWTYAVTQPIFQESAIRSQFTGAVLPSPMIELSDVDLSDVRTEVVPFGLQLRSVAALNLTVPCLITASTEVPIPVDLTTAAGAEMPIAPDDVEEWLGGARGAIIQLADASPALSYADISALEVMEALRTRTVAFVTTRILASWRPGTTKTTVHTVRVHTSTAGLRVHYSRNIKWRPVYFGAPSPLVTNALPGGRYLFGVDGPNMAMKMDSGVFDIPQVQDVHLSVA